MADIKEIKQGDTPTFRLNATANKVAIDIAGYTSASLKIAKSLNISNSEAMHYEIVLASSFSDGVNGIHDFVLSEDTTKVFPIGEYKYQLRLIDSVNSVTSSDVGDLNILQNLIDNEA